MGNVGTHRTWTVRMSRTEAEGRSVWENCPFKKGSLVYLEALIVPRMALRIGDYKARNSPADPGPGPLDLPGPKKWVNGSLVYEGPWPGDTIPLRVGCNLAVIPAWDHEFIPMQEGHEHPAPTYGSNEGVDCRGFSELEVWAVVAPGAYAANGDEIRAWPWVRHPTGFWSQPVDTFASVSAEGHRFVVKCRDADRVCCQVEYTTPEAVGGGGVLYGRLTPPPEQIPATSTEAPEIQIRFGAVLAPDAR